MLGNPPWDVSEYKVKDRPLDQRDKGKAAVAKANGFYAESPRFPLYKGGKLNLYAAFIEGSFHLIRADGYCGLVVPLSFVTDQTTADLFRGLSEARRLKKALGFENEELIFPGIHHASKFCLTVIGPDLDDSLELVVFARRIEHISDVDRQYSLSHSELSAFNPQSKTAPLFRTQADKNLAERIYDRNPAICSWSDQRFATRRGFYNISTQKSIFVELTADLEQGDVDQAEHVPLYEGKMISAFNHRFGTYEHQTEAQRRQGILPQVPLSRLSDPNYRVRPRYWVPSIVAKEKYKEENWNHAWVIGWRDVTSNVSERTAICCIIPKYAFEYGVFLLFGEMDTEAASYLVSLLNSLVFDYLARQKFAGSHLKPFFLFQCAAPDISRINPSDMEFIRIRTIELTRTSLELQQFGGTRADVTEIYSWNPHRRALLRAELDAYYAYLYGLTRRELEYIMDPKAVMGNDYPSETFRVLKESEIDEFDEYRTQRLVLEAWDRFVADGTFDASRLPLTNWPFTIEQAFSPPLRRAADAAGAWTFSGTPQAELMDNPELARRLFALLPTLGPADDAYWYLMAPAPEAKEAFSRWVTQPAQRTEANYAAFEEIARGLRNLLARRSGSEKREGPQAA